MTHDTNNTNPARKTSRARHTARVALISAAAIIGLGVTASTANAAATGTTGLHYVSAAACKGISSPVVAMSDVVSVNAPVIYAANTTSGLDGQFVSFRQRLEKWNGAAWVATNQYSSVWKGFATDNTAALDFSDGTRTVRQPAFNFNAGAGYYRVVTDYWWSNGTDLTVPAYHTPSSNTGFCGFAY